MSIFEDNVREVWPQEADTILGLVHGIIDPLSFPTTEVWNRDEDAPPIEIIMMALSEVLGGDGFDSIHPDSWNSNEYGGDNINGLILYVVMSGGFDWTILYDDDTGLFYADGWLNYVQNYNAPCDACDGKGYTIGIGNRNIHCQECHGDGHSRMGTGEPWKAYPRNST